MSALPVLLLSTLLPAATLDAPAQTPRSHRLNAAFSTAGYQSQADYGPGWSANGQPGGFELGVALEGAHVQVGLAGGWLHEGDPSFKVDTEPSMSGDPMVDSASGNRELAARLELLAGGALGAERRWTLAGGAISDNDFWVQVADDSPAYGLSWLAVASFDPALRLEWRPVDRVALRVTPHLSAWSWSTRPDDGFMDAAWLLAGLDEGRVTPDTSQLESADALGGSTLGAILTAGGGWSGPDTLLRVRLPLQARLEVTSWAELQASYTATWLRHDDPWTLRRRSQRFDVGAALLF